MGRERRSINGPWVGQRMVHLEAFLTPQGGTLIDPPCVMSKKAVVGASSLEKCRFQKVNQKC